MSVFRRTAPLSGAAMTIQVDGRAVPAVQGDTVATAMLAAGYYAIGANVKSGRPAAPLCLIGICFGCQCSIDGAPMRRPVSCRSATASWLRRRAR
jgi:hypothetical protein